MGIPWGCNEIKIKMFICFGCRDTESVSSLSGVLARDLNTNRHTLYIHAQAIIQKALRKITITF